MHTEKMHIVFIFQDNSVISGQTPQNGNGNGASNSRMGKAQQILKKNVCYYNEIFLKFELCIFFTNFFVLILQEVFPELPVLIRKQTVTPMPPSTSYL